MYAPALPLTAPLPAPFHTPQYEASGYDPSLLTGPIVPPATVNESLSTKPFVQQFYQKMVVGTLGPSQTLEQQTAYVNFYANLIKQSDAYLVRAAMGQRGRCRRCWGRRWPRCAAGLG